MIVGIGIDIVEIARVDKLLNKNKDAFLKKVFSDEELAQKENWQAANVAKRFAAKEAVAKALGCGFSKGVTMPQILISHDTLGKPQALLSGKAKERQNSLGVNNVQLSISDEKENAIAYCILEKTNDL